MTRYTTLLVLLAACSCKQLTPASQIPAQDVDSQLAVYRDQFLDDAAAHGDTVDSNALSKLRVIKFVDDIDAEKAKYGQSVSDSGDTIGTCAKLNQVNSLNLGYREWTTSSRSWSEVWIMNSYQPSELNGSVQLLQELMYHELGHCLLGLVHVAQDPPEVMSPELVQDPNWVSTNWTDLTAALFSKP